jgi:hypothetical protein
MNNSIRTYRNSVVIGFSERGENFTLKVPHYKEWISLIAFLRKRGFKIGVNKSYKENYTCLSIYHKLGEKKDVRVLMEITSQSIKLEFGNVKNLWTGHAQSFWSNKTDSRYTATTYLEDKAVQLEIKRVIERFKNKGFEYEPNDNDRTDIENIIHSLNRNTHIHGEISCLEDIGKSITETSYNYTQNSWDKNKKRIICGDKKCFYDYPTKRLVIGMAWHNINNMWWVIVNGKRHNKASFDLFDYDSNLPKRLPVTSDKINNLLSKFERVRDYDRCSKIKRYAEKLNLI